MKTYDLVIIGGGSTAAEYAGIYSSMGSQVDVLCRTQFLKILNDTEAEEYIVSKLLKNTMIHENVIIKEITDTSVITNYGEIEGTVLLATGVKANSEIVKDFVDIDEKDKDFFQRDNKVFEEIEIKDSDKFYIIGKVLNCK